MSGPGRNGRTFWGAAVTVLLLDIVTKYFAEQNLTLHVPQQVVGDLVRWTLAYNPGAAFSMSLGPASRWIFGGFAVVALVVLWQLHRSARPDERLKAVALGLAWGGAAGNLVDRVRSAAGVVDFIDIGVGSVRFWTFNVADSGVSVGAVVLGIMLLREERRQKPAAGD
ncbi:MAG: signal peptidase II [Gemmatimonadota bacterium]